jgi:hypothetical protein
MQVQAKKNANLFKNRMLISKYFTFIHLPKTGGEFIKTICEKALPNDWFIENEIGKHKGIKSIPSNYQHLPKFALIRNPWDWYVSWYHYRKQHNSKDPTWLLVSDRGKNDFHTTIKNICNGQHSIQAVAQKRKELDVDLLTIHHWNMLGKNPSEQGITVGRTEEILSCFSNFLQENMIPVPDSLYEFLQNAPIINKTKHSHYSEYYDESLRELIRYKSRHIIETYNYSFNLK